MFHTSEELTRPVERIFHDAMERQGVVRPSNAISQRARLTRCRREGNPSRKSIDQPCLSAMPNGNTENAGKTPFPLVSRSGEDEIVAHQTGLAPWHASRSSGPFISYPVHAQSRKERRLCPRHGPIRGPGPFTPIQARGRPARVGVTKVGRAANRLAGTR